jgi:hypothetical protein
MNIGKIFQEDTNLISLASPTPSSSSLSSSPPSLLQSPTLTKKTTLKDPKKLTNNLKQITNSSVSCLSRDENNELKKLKQKKQLNVYEFTDLCNHTTRKDDVITINFKQFIKEFTIKNILKQHKLLQSSNIIANTFYSNTLISLNNEDNLIVLSLVKDKIYQLLNDCFCQIEEDFERAKHLISNSVTVYDGYDASIEEVWNAMVKTFANHAKLLVVFAKQIPGFNHLSTNDFVTAINTHLFCLFGIRSIRLFISNECFIMVENIQLTRKWLLRLYGEMFTNKVFLFHEHMNKVDLTNREVAMLIPFVLSTPGKIFSLLNICCSPVTTCNFYCLQNIN